MNWQKLDRENTQKIINSVKSAVDPGLFSIATSEIERAPLRFYEGYALYKLTNYASLPSFSFQYLGNGTFFHYLDGTEAAIYAVNDKGVLQLGEYNILEYLSFYFDHVTDEDGNDVTLIRDIHDMPLFDSLDPQAHETVLKSHQPAKVEYDAGYDSYQVQAELFKDGQLIRATITVNDKGRVEVIDQKMIMQEVIGSGVPGALV